MVENLSLLYIFASVHYSLANSWTRPVADHGTRVKVKAVGAVERNSKAVIALAELGAVAGEGQHQARRALAVHARRTMAGLQRRLIAATLPDATMHHAGRKQSTYN